MENIKIILVACCAIFSSMVAQDKSGIVTYRGVVNEKFVDSFLIDLKTKDIPMYTKQGVIEMLGNAEEEEFELHFQNEESFYFNIPSLKTTEGLTSGSRAGVDPYYTNNATDTIVERSRSLGYISRTPLDWEITNKTKQIGDYTCYQATVTERRYSRQGDFYYRDVIAWFTPEIPLNFGPKHFKGLPGLILQIEENEYTLTAIKLNLNPENKDLKIKRLDKNDKVISEEESYRRIGGLEADMERKYEN